LEDPRISRMYAALFGRKLSTIRARIWRQAVLRSGMLTALVLALLLGVLVFAVLERGKGNLHKLEAELQSKPQAVGPAIAQPGGQDPIVIRRPPLGHGAMPEFLSATLLPGRGMNVLQITAQIPSLGEVPLMMSPSVEEATKEMSGTGSDAHGLASLSMGGAFEAPWANRMGGVPTPDGENVMAVWKGLTMVLPAVPRDGDAAGTSLGGLLLKRRANTVETHVVPDGWQSRLAYRAGSFDGHWLSQTEITTLVLLNGKVIELGVAAKNTGSVAEPIGIGWRPRFAIPSGDRADALLRLPNGMRVEMRGRKEGQDARLPTGKLLPIPGTEFDFTKQGGAKLGTQTVNESFVELKRGTLDIGPVVELRDVKGKFGLRITALTPTIKEIRVEAPGDKAMVTIDPQFNFDDPFGKEWDKDQDTGMVVLQPGQMVEWKVRLELFPLAMETTQHF
jgi:aldose 1-epimerase